MKTIKPISWCIGFRDATWWTLIVWAIMVLVATSGRAEALKGLDLLGLARMDAKMISEEIDNGTAIGTLDSTFGDPYPKLGLLASTGKVSAYRVHLRDFTCYRSSHCPPGYPAQNDTRPIRKAALRLAAFQSHYNIPCFVSPALEHDVRGARDTTSWFRILDEVLPNCVPVCSAFTGYCPKVTPNGRRILIEKHGNSVNGDVVSNDGASIFDADTSTYFGRGKVLSFAWDYSFNGRVSGESVFAPPLKRVDWPTKAGIKHSVAILRSGTQRPQVTGCSPIRKPELFKTNAEYYGKNQDDGRGNKGLFISQKYVGTRIEVTSLGGKSVGLLRYFGPYSGGGFRYYLGSGSGQTPIRLMQDLGGEWGLLRWRGGCRVFNAIRREGYYR